MMANDLKSTYINEIGMITKCGYLKRTKNIENITTSHRSWEWPHSYSSKDEVKCGENLI